MEAKKTKKANLEGLRGIFFECGLVLSLFVMIVAFSWPSNGEVAAVFSQDIIDVPDDFDVPITDQNDPPPPQEIIQPAITDEILIVDNTMNVTGVSLFDPENMKAPVTITPYEGPKKQEKEVIQEDDFDINVVQVRPTTWDGGDANSFSKWVSSKIVYPTVALENRIQGRVILQFRIGSDGMLGNIKVLRGIDPSLDKEAVRVVSSSPKWNPGMQNNKAVGVIYTFPVNFVLTE